MYGTEQLAQYIVKKHNDNTLIQHIVNESPEPLRAMIYEAIGHELASTIDGTDLYAEVVDWLETMY